MKRIQIITILILTLALINFPSATNAMMNNNLGPLIYSEETTLTIYQGSSTTLSWIVISKNPKSFYITNTNNGTTALLQDSKPVLSSKIQINPVGIPVGENIIKLYVSDYYNLVSFSSVNVTVLQASITSSIATSSIPPTTSLQPSKFLLFFWD